MTTFYEATSNEIKNFSERFPEFLGFSCHLNLLLTFVKMFAIYKSIFDAGLWLVGGSPPEGCRVRG
jgi:hypothetical protein